MKPGNVKVDLDINYAVMEIPNDFIVGYGLIGAGLIGIAYFFIMRWLMKDTPQK